MTQPLHHADFHRALAAGHHARVLRHLQHHPIPHPQAHQYVASRSPLMSLQRWEKPRAMEVMEALLKAGADPNATDPAGRLPLHTWIWLADAPKAAIQALLAAGADPLIVSTTTQGKTTQTALEACVYHTQLPKLEWLLEVQPDLARRHDLARTEPSLLYALVLNTSGESEQERNAMQLLLDHGASLDVGDKFGRTAREALTGANLALVEHWEAHQRANTQAGDLDQETPDARLDARRPRI